MNELESLNKEENQVISQTDSENQPPAPEEGSAGAQNTEEQPQTDSAPKRATRRRMKAAESESESDEQAPATEIQREDDVAAPGSGKKLPYVKPSMKVISIGERLSVETEADKAKNDLLDLLESMRASRLLTGIIQGVERSGNTCRAVLYHGIFKIVIPGEEVIELPKNLRGQEPETVRHYLLTKRLGAEIDYVIKGIDPDADVAVASRLEAMRAKRKQYYLDTDRSGNQILYSGVCAEARVVAVVSGGIFVDIFGQETHIPTEELSYQRMVNPISKYHSGDKVIVKILDIDKTEPTHIKVVASVKQVNANPSERMVRRYSVGNRYVGTVAMVNTSGVFVTMDGSIDCLCSLPKRGRPPVGARVTVRILGISVEEGRIWGAITHVAAVQ